MSQVVIRLADICNLECNMCDFVHSSTTYGQKMKISDFKAIVRKLKNASIHGQKIDKIRLDGNREGLLYPDITEAVRIVREEGFEAFLVTNGVQMNETVAEGLIDAGLCSVNFSVSGITEKTYSDFQGYNRPRGQLQQVLCNIEKFIEINARRGGKVWTSVSMLMDSQTAFSLAKEYREAILMYKNMGVNSVLIGSKYPEPKMREAVGGPGCLSIPIVGVDGEVSPCCGGIESISLGNLFDDSVEDIFDGDKFYSLCKGLKRRDGCKLPEACKYCVYNGLPKRKTESFYMEGDLDLSKYNKSLSECLGGAEEKKLYVIGANDLAKEFLSECRMKNVKVDAIIDNDYLKWGDYICETQIISPKEASNHQIYVNCIRNQSVGNEVMKRYEGDKYLYAMFLECIGSNYPVFSYSYILN